VEKLQGFAFKAPRSEKFRPPKNLVFHTALDKRSVLLLGFPICFIAINCKEVHKSMVISPPMPNP